MVVTKRDNSAYALLFMRSLYVHQYVTDYCIDLTCKLICKKNNCTIFSFKTLSYILHVNMKYCYVIKIFNTFLVYLYFIREKHFTRNIAFLAIINIPMPYVFYIYFKFVYIMKRYNIIIVNQYSITSRKNVKMNNVPHCYLFLYAYFYNNSIQLLTTNSSCIAPVYSEHITSNFASLDKSVVSLRAPKIVVYRQNNYNKNVNTPVTIELFYYLLLNMFPCTGCVAHFTDTHLLYLKFNQNIVSIMYLL